MATVKYIYILIPFVGEPKIEVKEYRILARNKHGYMVLNDMFYTTLAEKSNKHATGDYLNKLTVYKSKYGWKDDGWRVRGYFQCSEKIIRNKAFNALKKEIQKEMFLDSTALEKLKSLFK